jgi:hypothetical protein
MRISHSGSSLAGALFLALLTGPSAYALGISLGPSSIDAYADDGGVEHSTYIPTSVPDSGSVTATHGGVTATTGFAFSDSGITLTFDHIRAPTLYAAAYGGTAVNGDRQIQFVPNANVPYVLEGVYTTVDVDGGYVEFRAAFLDITANTVLFVNAQSSDSTPNESFVLGLQQGDRDNHLVGSLSGMLIAGHTYALTTLATTQSLSNATTSATGTGHLSLTFVPEPSTGLLVIAGLLGFAVRRKAVD